MCFGGFLDDAFDFVGDVFGGLGKTFEGALSGDFGNILSLASMIPGPQQPFLLGANAVNNLAEGNVAGAGLSALGAAGGIPTGEGGITSATDLIAPGSTDLVNADFLDGTWDTIGKGATDFGQDALDYASDGFGSVLDGAGSGAAAGGDALGDFIQQLPSNRLEGTGIAGGTTGIGNFMDSIGAAPMYDAFALGSSVPMMAQSIQSSPFSQTVGGLAKLYGGWQDYNAAQDARRAYRSNLAQLDNLYSVDSPYARDARRRVERRDAARGRNSQYGARENELAAMLTNQRAAMLNSPGYLSQLGAANMRSAGLGGLLGGATSFLSGLGSYF